jgi:hypothetical protein
MHTRKYVLMAMAALLSSPVAIAQPIEDEVDIQLNRLEAKYTGNKTMILTLAKLRRDWREYQSSQCFFEKTIATGGAVVKGTSASAGKARQICLARTKAEMKASLEKF